jgi:hypothetical protein
MFQEPESAPLEVLNLHRGFDFLKRDGAMCLTRQWRNPAQPHLHDSNLLLGFCIHARKPCHPQGVSTWCRTWLWTSTRPAGIVRGILVTRCPPRTIMPRR